MTSVSSYVHNVMSNKWTFCKILVMTNFLRRAASRWIDSTRMHYAASCIRCCVQVCGVLCVLSPLQVQASIPSEQPITGSDQKIAKMVFGIISYTQWSQLPDPLHLCVIDSPHYFNVLQSVRAQSQPRVRVSLKTAQFDDLTQHCHVLFFDQTPAAQQQTIINQRGVHQILTLSLNNPTCSVGSSFCIQRHQDSPSFSINLDSLKQSGVKISSKVLILAKPSSSQE